MYTTLYEVSIIDCYLRCIASPVVIIIFFIFFLIIGYKGEYDIKKYYKENNLNIKELENDQEYKDQRLAKRIVTIIFPFVFIFSIYSIYDDIVCSNYLYNEYQQGNIHMVEGKVENYKIIEDNQSRTVSFAINDIKFLIDRNVSFGYRDYTASGCKIKNNGQKLRITYMLNDDLSYKDYDTLLTYETGNTIVKIQEFNK